MRRGNDFHNHRGAHRFIELPGISIVRFQQAHRTCHCHCVVWYQWYWSDGPPTGALEVRRQSWKYWYSHALSRSMRDPGDQQTTGRTGRRCSLLGPLDVVHSTFCTNEVYLAIEHNHLAILFDSAGARYRALGYDTLTAFNMDTGFSCQRRCAGPSLSPARQLHPLFHTCIQLPSPGLGKERRNIIPFPHLFLFACRLNSPLTIITISLCVLKPSGSSRGLIYTHSLILSFSPPFAPSLSLRDREPAADLTFPRTHNSMDYPPVLHIGKGVVEGVMEGRTKTGQLVL